MDISLTLLLVQIIATILYIILIYITIKSNQRLNKQNIFTEIVKQERQLKIKLLEYRDIINNKKLNVVKREGTKLDYDTLLFNYYEFLAICLYNKFINEREAKLFFKSPLISVKEMFDNSLLFTADYADESQYPFIRWLFKKWDIDF